MKRTTFTALLLAFPLALSALTTTAHAAPASAAPADDGFWTTCQEYTWAVQGCAQYGREAAAWRPCLNGREYYCVSPTEGQAQPAAVEPSARNAL